MAALIEKEILKMKRRIKAVFYNNVIDINLLCVCVIIIELVALLLNCPCLVAIVGTISLIYVVIYLISNYVFNKTFGKLKCLKYSKSLLVKNVVWINQRFRIVMDDYNKCPQKEFVRELGILLKIIPKGTVCYCCTHEKIKKQIIRRFPEAECTLVYKKDLLGLKKKVKCKKCKQCANQKCSLNKKDKTLFYAIKWVM